MGPRLISSALLATILNTILAWEEFRVPVVFNHFANDLVLRKRTPGDVVAACENFLSDNKLPLDLLPRLISATEDRLKPVLTRLKPVPDNYSTAVSFSGVRAKKIFKIKVDGMNHYVDVEMLLEDTHESAVDRSLARAPTLSESQKLRVRPGLLEELTQFEKKEGQHPCSMQCARRAAVCFLLFSMH